MQRRAQGSSSRGARCAQGRSASSSCTSGCRACSHTWTYTSGCASMMVWLRGACRCMASSTRPRPKPTLRTSAPPGRWQMAAAWRSISGASHPIITASPSASSSLLPSALYTSFCARYPALAAALLLLVPAAASSPPPASSLSPHSLCLHNTGGQQQRCRTLCSQRGARIIRPNNYSLHRQPARGPLMRPGQCWARPLAEQHGSALA